MAPGHNSARDIALRLYSQLLSLFSAVIIIIEEDFGGLAAVVHELAMWVMSSSRTPSRIRPRVKIVTAQRTHASKKLEWELTVEILTNFNPFCELSFKAADSLWREFFGGIEHISEPQSIGELYRMVPSMALRPRIGGYQLTELLRVALRQFCRCQKQPFSLISAVCANRKDPAPTEFPLVEVLKGRVGTLNELNVVSKLIASALTVHGYRPGSVEAAFPPKEIFEEFYLQPLQRLATQANLPTIIAQVYAYFAKFAGAAVAGDLDPVSHHQQVLKGMSSLLMNCLETCLSCLVRAASNGLPCGHRLCDICVAILSQDAEGQSFRLPKCVFCGAANDTPLHVKPSTAGARILRLAGPVEAAPAIARSLRSLRSAVQSPLSHHFDMVTASGIGMFFAVMLFCKRATVEDCIHHIPNLECAKTSRRGGLNFGRRLRFRWEEVVTNGVRLFLLDKRWRRECVRLALKHVIVRDSANVRRPIGSTS
jgi:hypothetical protein